MKIAGTEFATKVHCDGKVAMKASQWIVFLGTLFVFLVSATGCAQTSNDLDFFRGQTVTIIVPHGPGGMDTYARSIAPYLQKYLPGSKVEVVNVSEGGGITGRNQIYAAAPDGLTLGLTTGAGALLAEWAEQPGVEYKTAEFSFIGRINAEPHIMVASPRMGFTTLDDIVRAKKISMGFAGVGSDDYYVALVTARLLGYEVEPHTDFLGIDGASLACVKGDVAAILFSESSVQQQLEAHTLVPIVSFSEVPSKKYPNIPVIFSAIPADKQETMQALVNIYALERVIIAPPGMSQVRLQTLRHALDQAMNDPEFLDNMLQIKRPVSFLNGQKTSDILAGIMLNADQIKPLVLQIARETR